MYPLPIESPVLQDLAALTFHVDAKDQDPLLREIFVWVNQG